MNDLVQLLRNVGCISALSSMRCGPFDGKFTNPMMVRARVFGMDPPGCSEVHRCIEADTADARTLTSWAVAVITNPPGPRKFPNPQMNKELIVNTIALSSLGST